jgi:Ca-activated chloride channel family protein
VTDAKNDLVNNLAKTDFEIFEDGIPQEIRFFSPVSAPYNVFLLFDRSESTRDKWTFMQRAVLKFMEGLRPQDRVALGSFDNAYDVNIRWSADPHAVAGAVETVFRKRGGNGTRFYAALDRTLRNEFKNVAGRRAVVVLTDGKDTDYVFENDKDLKRVLKSSVETRIPIYIIALQDENDKFVVLPSSRKYLIEIRTNMQEFTNRSGGKLVFAKSLDEIGPMYEEIGRALGTSYSLGYVSSRQGSSGTYRRIEVKVRRTGTHLTQSRQGYTVR